MVGAGTQRHLVASGGRWNRGVTETCHLPLLPDVPTRGAQITLTLRLRAWAWVTDVQNVFCFSNVTASPLSPVIFLPERSSSFFADILEQQAPRPLLPGEGCVEDGEGWSSGLALTTWTTYPSILHPH